EVWSLPALEDDAAAPARDTGATEARARIEELGGEREPWQRADETVENYGDARGLETDDGAAVYRTGGPRGGNLQLLQIAGEAGPLLSALRRLGTVSVVNLPAEDAAAEALRSLGATVAVRQHEMLLELSPTGGH